MIIITDHFQSTTIFLRERQSNHHYKDQLSFPWPDRKDGTYPNALMNTQAITETNIQTHNKRA